MRARRSGPWCVLGALAAACHPTHDPVPPATNPVVDASSDPAPTEDPTAKEPPIESCGAEDLSFADHAWAPADAPAVASLRLDDPDLDTALAALAEHSRAPGHGLPIPLALSLSQWSWQVPLLTSTLRTAGFWPAELTFVASKDAQHAWVWRSDCDLDHAIDRIQQAWSVAARRTVDGVVATPPPSPTDDPTFPYDVLMLSGDRMALVPAGAGSQALTRLGGRPRAMGSLGPPSSTAGARLDEISEAPIRLVLLGVALVDPAAPSASDTQLLRVTAQGVVPAPADSNDASVAGP